MVYWARDPRAFHVSVLPVDIELAEPLRDIDAPGYGAVHALVRLHGAPVGAVTVPVTHGRCVAHAVAATIIDLLAPGIVRRGVRHALDRPVRAMPLGPEELVAPPDAARVPLPGVTVAVCTRERESDLGRCLDALVRLDHPDLELLVVHNTEADDATERIVRRYGARVRYIREPGAGLDRARNRAIVEATRDIVAFTDDDVAVDAGWVRAIARVFGENAEVQAVTGLVMPLELETPAQQLFEAYLGFGRGFERRWYESRVRNGRAIALRLGNTGKMGTGANMAFRRAALRAIGGFDPALDAGTATHGGGDLDVFFRVLKAGGTLVYEPSALVRHRHRRNLAELRDQLADWGVGMRSYVARNATAFPDERVPFATLVTWLLGTWHLRRLLGALARREPLADLVLAEMSGLLRGGEPYRRARVMAARTARACGDSIVPAPPPGEGVRAHAGGHPRLTYAERVVELSDPPRALDDLDGVASVRLVFTCRGRVLRTTVIHTAGRGVSAMRVGDIAAPLAARELAGLPSGREGWWTCRQLARRMLEALQPGRELRVGASRRSAGAR